MHADTCYTRDIEFLNSSILLVLQDYTNQHNYNTINNFNNYGASLILYNLQQNETVKTITLQNAGIIDYSYVYTPKNTNLVLVYYTNKITNDQGYLSINVDTGYTYLEFGNNLKSFTTALNHPLVINSKILVFYSSSFAWYSINPQTLDIWFNALIYLGVLVAVLILLPERWKPKLNIINKIVDYRKKR